MDTFSREKRSQIMSRISGKNTKPELIVRSLLHNLGYRFRLHRIDLPGKPDITLPKYKKVIFVHGCFWHGHKGCKRSRRPTTNEKFWNKKLAGNMERDKRYYRDLRAMGWQILIVWECDTKNTEKLMHKLKRLF
ncbi:MAG: very short patch repair endonuclease [Pseudomonadota bacterium]